MRKLIIFTVLLSMPFIYGFATVVSGTKQSITFNSSPSGAEVVSNGMVLGLTPLTIDIKRSEGKTGKTIIIRKVGYKDETLNLTTKFNMTFWGNVLIGGTIGSSIDSSMGATVEYDPGQFHVNLTPEIASLQELDTLNKEKLSRNFILFNYHNLTADIARGEGEYLSNFFASFNISSKDQADALAELKKLTSRFEDIPSFAEGVMNQFLIAANGKLSVDNL